VKTGHAQINHYGIAKKGWPVPWVQPVANTQEGRAARTISQLLEHGNGLWRNEDGDRWALMSGFVVV
jgi:hypothetical protein